MGKKLSIITKIIAAIFVCAFYIVSLFTRLSLPGGTIGLLQIGGFIAIMGMPIDASIVIQHIKGTRNAN